MREHGGTAMAMRAGLRVAAAATLVVPGTARAADNAVFFGRDLAAGEIVLLAILIGAVTFAVLSAITLINARNRAENENSRLRLEVADLKAATERVEALAASEDQRLVAWGAPGEAPLVAGSIAGKRGDAEGPCGVPGLRDVAAARIGRPPRPCGGATARGGRSLRHRHRDRQRPPDRGPADGPSAALAVVRFRDLTGDATRPRQVGGARRSCSPPRSRRCARCSRRHRRRSWLRDEGGRLIWVNEAYAAAVEAKSGAEAVEPGPRTPRQRRPQADRLARTKAIRSSPNACRRSSPVRGASSTSSMSPRRTAAPASPIDVTAIEAAEAALRREIDFNARTLDQLATAVAIFGPDRRLRSYNAAYREPVRPRPGVPRFRIRKRMPCSIACGRRASSPSRPISAAGATSSSRPTGRRRRASTGGTCPTARRCASSPTPIRRAA